jgi:hypothetical protein
MLLPESLIWSNFSRSRTIAPADLFTTVVNMETGVFPGTELGGIAGTDEFGGVNFVSGIRVN